MKQPMGPALPGTKQVLLAFNQGHVRPRDVSGRHVESYTEYVNLPFLPKGLMLWGATGDTLVHTVKVGNTTEVEIGGLAPMPGLYFAQGRSFEDIVRLADAGELDVSIEARQQLEMNEAYPGNTVSVSLSGPCDRLVLWGVTYSLGGPHRRAVVEALAGGGFSARLDEVTLRGIATVLDVTAPDAASAASLLVGLETSRFARSLRGL